MVWPDGVTEDVGNTTGAAPPGKEAAVSAVTLGLWVDLAGKAPRVAATERLAASTVMSPAMTTSMGPPAKAGTASALRSSTLAAWISLMLGEPQRLSPLCR